MNRTEHFVRFTKLALKGVVFDLISGIESEKKVVKYMCGFFDRFRKKDG